MATKPVSHNNLSFCWACVFFKRNV